MKTNAEETKFLNALDDLLVGLDYLDELNNFEEKKERLTSIAFVINAINNNKLAKKLFPKYLGKLFQMIEFNIFEWPWDSYRYK